MDEREREARLKSDEIQKPLSRHQYGTLRFFSKNDATIEHLRGVNATTLGSLLVRGYLQKAGSGDKAAVLLTKRGEEALHLYSTATINSRSHEWELTTRCLELLRYRQRRVVAMTRAA